MQESLEGPDLMIVWNERPIQMRHHEWQPWQLGTCELDHCSVKTAQCIVTFRIFLIICDVFLFNWDLCNAAV